MRQRVVIAMALALGPQVLLMDEPTTALDVVVQAEILDELDRLRRELGFSVLLVSHDLPLMLERCDRISVMYAGASSSRARSISTAARPSHPYAKHLLGHPYAQHLLQSFPRLEGPRTISTRARGEPAQPLHAAAGLPLPPALPGGDADLQGGAAAADAAGRRPRRRLPPQHVMPAGRASVHVDVVDQQQLARAGHACRPPSLPMVNGERTRLRSKPGKSASGTERVCHWPSFTQP